MKKSKKASVPSTPNPSKRPRIDKWPNDSSMPSWRLSIIDSAGRWGWHEDNINRDKLIEIITDKIRNFESMSWQDIYRGGSHEISIEDIIPDARKRLSELGMNDIDDLFSLRLMGKERIWGIKESSVLKVLWWDPNHEVCPAPLKHT